MIDCFGSPFLVPSLTQQLVQKVSLGQTVEGAVQDIIARTVIELRKNAFGDDVDDAKALPWSREQAWTVVSLLAEKGEVSVREMGRSVILALV